MAEGSEVRAIAAGAVHRVLEQGAAADRVMTDAISRVAIRDRGLARELISGTLRWAHRLRVIRDAMLERPLGRKDARVATLILVGLYQLEHTDVPPHAAVSATVDAVSRIGSQRMRGVVNALLRRYLREREALGSDADTRLDSRHAHPVWMIERFRRDWPEAYAKILDAGNARPPMWLRVNVARTDPEEMFARLAEAGLEPEVHRDRADAILIGRPVEVGQLPGFNEGLISVQDAAAQLAARLLDVGEDQRVLDACAAPGGKTCHLLERGHPRELVALDLDGDRLARLQSNLDRLSLGATLVRGDATTPSRWWDGRAFDRILVDAPCTGTGVIRRHPDIKHHRRPEDVTALAALQTRILDASWTVLAPGGRLVYSTCSVLREENEARISAFLETHDDAREDPIGAGWGRACEHGRQILSGEANQDGFYYACLTKRATG